MGDSEDGATAATHLVVDSEILLEVDPPADLDLGRLEELIHFALTAEQATGTWTVTVLLTDDGRLRQLHHDFMGIDAATDVMTFPFGDEANYDDASRGGEIVISVQRAGEQATDFGLTPSDEVRFLVLHGILHLCGWSDRSTDDRSAMLSRQTELLRAFDSERGSG